MTIRALAGAIALLAATGVAHADEVRTVPAPGIKLTYRLVSTIKTPTKTISTGQVYTYIVAKSDGTTAEGVIKPNAIIIPCEGESDLVRAHLVGHNPASRTTSENTVELISVSQ
ncbi:MAG: hypothetical protein WAV02_08935 [Stellaceae bacterium]